GEDVAAVQDGACVRDRGQRAPDVGGTLAGGREGGGHGRGAAVAQDERAVVAGKGLGDELDALERGIVREVVVHVGDRAGGIRTAVGDRHERYRVDGGA